MSYIFEDGQRMAKGRQKTFTDYLNERLDVTETQRLQKAAELEKEYFRGLKKELNMMVREHMERNNIGMTKLAQLLCSSDARTLRVIAGEHGFTMATVARIGAALGMKPHIIFEEE